MAIAIKLFKIKAMKFTILFSLVMMASLSMSGQPNNSKKVRISGDFIFRSVSITLFNAPDSLFKEMDLLIEKNSESENITYRWYGEVRNLNLMRTPFIEVKSRNSEEPIIVFIDWDTFRMLEKYNCSDLRYSGKKVRVTLDAVKLDTKSILSYQAINSPKHEIIKGKAICY